MLIEPPLPIYILSHRNCELHCCHLDGYKNYKAAFTLRLGLVEEYFAGAPKARQYRLWYNVDETVLDKPTVAGICASLARIHHHILKIAFVGVPIRQRLFFSRELNHAMPGKTLAHQFFSDAEKAKNWLV